LPYGIALHVVSSPIREPPFGEPITIRSVSRSQRNFHLHPSSIGHWAKPPAYTAQKVVRHLGHPSAIGATGGITKSSSKSQTMYRIRSRNPDTTTTQNPDQYSCPGKEPGCLDKTIINAVCSLSQTLSEPPNSGIRLTQPKFDRHARTVLSGQCQCSRQQRTPPRLTRGINTSFAILAQSHSASAPASRPCLAQISPCATAGLGACRTYQAPCQISLHTGYDL